MPGLSIFFTTALLGLNAVLWSNRGSIQKGSIRDRTRWALIVLGVVGIVLMTSGHIRRRSRSDVDDKVCVARTSERTDAELSGVMNGDGCVDTMHLNHVLLYSAIGLLVPYVAWPWVLALSVGWELAEHLFFKHVAGECAAACCFRSEDVVLNMLGYAIGSYLGVNAARKGSASFV